MRKSVLFFVLGLAVLAACALAGLRVALRKPGLATDKILASYRHDVEYGDLTIRYPRDGTLFPPEMVPPTFRWDDSSDGADAWLVTIEFEGDRHKLQGDQGRMSFPCFQPEWRPPDESWQTIKRRTLEKPATVTVVGVDRRAQDEILSAASISIRTSRDEVGAPLFFREVNLPFADAVKDPASHVRWRFGPISSPEPPPIVLENVPNCANCHSFYADGSTLAMEVDSANDKGSYVIAPVEEEMVFDPPKLITWSDYRREDDEETFGLLPQISPDGKTVICMVKDRSVFVAKPGLAFSQLFFPIKGILVYYRRETGTFHALPGADDKRFVHGNPTWSPDGKYIVFARSKVHEMTEVRDIRSRKASRLALLTRAECERFLEEVGTFQYDLYRIPFNDGKGGKAEPIRGASNNGMSNYFPKYSPDGKWIVFCRAKSFMLLQPDSELYIIPAEGGQARRLRCNTPRMNSWHSWSPNGKWLVFSSKWNSPYTQLCLTHIDERGRSTPPVVLANLTESNWAANIPEFVNTKPHAIKKIYPAYLDDSYYVRSGGEFGRQLDFDNAIRLYRKALDINPDNVIALAMLGDSLIRQGKSEDAKPYLERAIELAPGNPYAQEGLGTVLAAKGRFPEAVSCFRRALQIDPSRAPAHFRLGVLLMDLGAPDEATRHLAEAVRLDPDNARALCCLAVLLSGRGELDEAVSHFRRALQLDPDLLTALLNLASIRATSEDPRLRDGREAIELATRACQLTGYQDAGPLAVLSQAYAEVERYADAARTAEQAIRAAEAAGNEGLTGVLQDALESYRQRRPFRPSPP
jgi:tetratricopeptide (TPR) repeat protein